MPNRRASIPALVALSTATLLAGCGQPGDIAPTSGTTAPATASAATSVPSAAPPTAAQLEVRLNETLKLADGRSMKARCVGRGTPTILLEAGGSGDMGEWQLQFVNELGGTTTTCLYSRAGGRGSSPPSVQPPSMASVTSDAFEVLALAKEKAGVEGPYVWVGWSLGGSVALGEALSRPDQTVGVAILDTDFPLDFLPFCVAQGRTKADCQAEFDGDIDARFMESEIARAVHPLDVPAILVTAMDYPECVERPGATLSAEISGITVVAADCAGLASAIADKQIADWPAAFPEITQTRVDADHDGLLRSAGRQIAPLILAMVKGARAPS